MSRWMKLLIVVACAITANAQETVYWFNFPAGSDISDFHFPAPDADEVYHDSHTALRILSVVVDGNELIPEIYSPNGYPDMTVIRTKGGRIVYQCSRGFFQSFINLKWGPKAYEVKKFRVPHNAKLIEVKYHVRFPNGKESKLMQVNFAASDEKTSVFQAPKPLRQK